MSNPPEFSPSSLNFGTAAPSSQVALSVSCPPVAAGLTVAARIQSSKLLSPFAITSVGAPPPANVKPATGLGGGSSTSVGGVTDRIDRTPRPGSGISAAGSGSSVGIPTASGGITGTVAAGDDVQVDLLFQSSVPGSYSAVLEISSDQWNTLASIPLQGAVTDVTLTCPSAVTVKQNSSTTVTLTVVAQGQPTTANLWLYNNLLPAGVTVSIEPTTLSLAPGVAQHATMTVTAALNAPPSRNELQIYAEAFGNAFTGQTKLSVAQLKIQTSPASPIADKYEKLKALLGSPLWPEQFCSDFFGQFRAYQHGAIYWSGAKGADAYEVHGPALTLYLNSVNPEIGAPPGYPSESPTAGDYASAPAVFGYPISDVTDATTGVTESRFENDIGIYVTSLGTFSLVTENFYRQQGGCTGPLGLPIANGIGGTTGSPPHLLYVSNALTQAFSYQDFENGGIFSSPGYAGGNPEAILFSKPSGQGQPFKIPGTQFTSTLYLQPAPAGTPVFFIPLWALLTIPQSQITSYVQQALSTKVAAANTGLSSEVHLINDLAPLNPPVTGYVAPSGVTPTREYGYGFSLQASGDLVAGAYANVTFDLYPYLAGNTADVPNQSLQIVASNANTAWTQDGIANIPQDKRGELTSAIASAGQSLALPSSENNVPYNKYENVDLVLYWISAKLLADGTLCLLATIAPTQLVPVGQGG
jgi:hypothetical protein